jgi:Tol biopolymer transport system component
MRRALSISFIIIAAMATGLMALPAGAAPASATIRVSVASDGTQGNNMSGRFSAPALSRDGQVTAFDSTATNLVPNDMGQFADVFVHDSSTGVTERVSVSTGGRQGNADSQRPSVDRHGRFVAFDSSAGNLVSHDTNQLLDVFVRDRARGKTLLVSGGMNGASGNGSSFGASISASGRFVAFVSDASNLVQGDTNNVRDVFVRDLVAGTTQLVSVASDGTLENSSAAPPSINADGTKVAFASFATNLVPNDTNDQFDVFVRDLAAGTTVRASVATDGTEGDQASFTPAISGDGRSVAFASDASNLVPNDTNDRRDVFLHDLVANRTLRVSLTASGAQANGQSVGPGVRGGLVFGPAINFDGTRIAFDSVATNLVAGDTNTCEPFFPDPGQCPDVFVRDLRARTTIRVSVASDGSQGNDATTDPAMDGSGRTVAFFSAASNLVAADTNFCIQFPIVGHCPDIFDHTGS